MMVVEMITEMIQQRKEKVVIKKEKEQIKNQKGQSSTNTSGGGGGDTHTIKKIKLGGEITKKNWIKWCCCCLLKTTWSLNILYILYI